MNDLLEANFNYFYFFMLFYSTPNCKKINKIALKNKNGVMNALTSNLQFITASFKQGQQRALPKMPVLI